MVSFLRFIVSRFYLSRFFFQPSDMSEARFWVLYFIIYILSNISSKNSLQISSNLQLNV